MNQDYSTYQTQLSIAYRSRWENAAGQTESMESGNTVVFDCVLPTKKLNDDQNEVITVEIPGNSTVRHLRILTWMQATRDSASPSIYTLTHPNSYQFLYKKGLRWYEIYDDHQIIQTLDSVRYWKNSGMKKGSIYIKSNPKETEESDKLQKKLTYLIGYDIRNIVTHRRNELSFAQRKLASSRQVELSSRDVRAYAMEPWVVSSPLSKSLMDLTGEGLVIAIHYNDSSHKMKVGITDTPVEIIHSYMQKMADKGWPIHHPEDNLAFKVCGREEHITGGRPLIDFIWIRRCIKNKEDIRLMLVLAPCAEDDEVDTDDWPLVDQHTGLCGTHDELTLRNKDIDQILVLSLWDCNSRFRVKVVGIDCPALPHKSLPHIYVEACILHAKTILSSARSQPLPFTEEVIWNIWLQFDILVKNLPRGSRLSFFIYGMDFESLSTRDAKTPPQRVEDGGFYKGRTKLLYFVSFLLIDHRSFLQQGEHILHMWPYADREEDLFTHEADKLSSKTNPDVDNSMAICIMLDTYSHPLVLPTGRTSRSSCINQMSEDAELTSTMNIRCKKLPLPLTVSEKNLQFTEQCSQYGNSLPNILSSVKWGKLEAVEEAHCLCEHWNSQQLDIAIALELLSISFADEKVRNLAVQRLEELDNNELLRYLLQLVQALKFEPYHDSALARFLIRCGLRSKRIGHFFFWYLRSEITGSPYFCDRFAVILEAYLLGCGKSMLDEFYKQVQVVESLHQVATDIKKIIPEKNDLPPNAASLLQDMLRKADLPQSFLVPYDPRIKTSGILLERCRIMASKKKPLWLEFSCGDEDSAHCQPVGIIFKHGDDLRQDMLIIQTLVIMDSIWQENSLDLNLVPYGCISTGYNIGMIEIVRDATTIAAVQRSQGGTTAAFKNEALHEWLRSRLQVEESYYQAMETFVTSCAGYCIATYILGIGDRHNDNIMVTAQGNLFHIDFGHILGNTKRFLGVNRERAPFVLTPDFLFVMGKVNKRSSLYFQRFKDICIEAYLSLRAHSKLLVNLFSLMTLTGIPELTSTKSIQYLKEALAMEKDEKMAQEHILNQIEMCESLGWTVQANWWIHMFMGVKQTKS
ncbi:phosphatidylinositol 4,5-bisphosphate 3-kinase catalytic subunit gamma isoform [Callorhinchus milii]|uniref:phosphatidylinositol 4,5-bisphosphate 3-kinase catalytic subunit gamma isoform n=1 Tax=Callorhinchus milii TaxID=7868 RepID=UPI001C3FD4DD|nr:phosphatidylinositol 4,5-bisphosphate 3-kinase catalytic subunit gamma isoform [Callorhinchus milii]